MLLVVLCFGFHPKTIGQNTTSLPTIISSAPPNAAALARYGEVPVSYGNGLANIGVDLGTVSSGDLMLPIGLSYHSGGIKVNDVASNVGLGWSLNAGGAIVNNGTFNSWYSSVEQVGTWNLNTGNEGIGVAQCQEYAPADRSAAANYIEFANLGDSYLELDKFSYNFAGRAGSIFFKKQPSSGVFKGYTMPYSDWDITYSSLEIIVIDDKGIIYKFDKIGSSYDITTCDNGNPENGNPYGIAYYLSQITSPNGHFIKLEYVTENYKYDASKNQSVTVRFSAEIDDSATTNQSTANDLCTFNGLNTVNECSIERNVEEPRLTKITSSSGEEVSFFYSSRLDLLNTKLDRVEFGFRNASNTYTKNKEFKFTFDYFNSISNPTDHTERRLKLTKVEECYGTSCLKEHSFEYNSITLPKRTSYAQDWYGYYNGHNNTYFYPGSTYLNNTGLTGAEKNGGNRNTNVSYVKAGVLERINYPTGGTTEFEYEPNLGGGLRILRIKNYQHSNGGATTSDLRRFTYNNSGYSIGSLGTYENLYEEVRGQDLEIYGYQSGFRKVNCKFITISSTPKPYSRIEGDVSTKYQHVTELFGENGENGKIEYKFSKKDDIISSTDNASFTEVSNVVTGPSIPVSWVKVDYSWLYGLLLEKTFFENTGSNFIPIEKTINEYKIEHLATAFTSDSSNPKEIYGRGLTIELERKGSSGNNGQGSYYSFCNKYRMRYYKFISAPVKLVKTRNTKYDKESEVIVENVVEFDYENPDYIQLSKRKEYVASNPSEYWVSEYYYPQDKTSISGLTVAQSKALEDMEASNMLGALVEERTFKGTSKLSTLRNNFKLFTSGHLTESTSYAKGNGNLETRVRYHDYDDHGNPLMVSQENGTKKSYLWGYSNAYPVIAGENITHSDLETAVNWAIGNISISGVSDLEGLLDHIGAMTTQSQKTAWSSFLVNLNSHANIGEKGLITAMTYKQGIGVTSQTTPNGLTTYYEYDDFNRLSIVKDHYGKVLKKYEYKYQESISNTNN
ncbi:MAG: hypothetical protein DCO95_09535 [Roseivirga sp. XM-24bin3]|nr:MAG: hypothetical protein DCO95_09535 [Roseivirga sp. XM-24bin3]